MKRFSASKGFTLIELLIVIAILGVLAAAVLVAINPGQKINAARNSRVRADLASIGRNAELFNTDTGLSTTCTSASYPSASAQTACSATFVTVGKDPNGTDYSINVTPGGCSPTGTSCTGFSVRGPVYNDGTITTGSGAYWCYRSSLGSVTQVASCAP